MAQTHEDGAGRGRRGATRGRTVVIAAALLASTSAAHAAVITPAQKCESDKNKLAGQYDACRQKAESKFALTGDGAGAGTEVEQCVVRRVRG